ncbi:hypothetical protein ACLOJK_035561 [Asimina triloba]
MVSETTTTHSKSVCVIGGGPSGLVAARELRKEGHSVVVIEQKNDIGGQWLYDPCEVACEDALGRGRYLKVHSSVYASLRLTSSREIMGFTDFPFVVKKGRDMRRFPGHRELFLYLSDFCDRFGLREMIRFNTRVEYAGMLNYAQFGKELKWVVRTVEQTSDEVTEEVFDAVVVATGHYSHPRLPCIKAIKAMSCQSGVVGGIDSSAFRFKFHGLMALIINRRMDSWKRRQLHSHVYRVPQPFSNEVVVVIGNSLSGQDISMELVDVAKEVHLSCKSLEISEGLSKVISKNQTLHIHPQVESLHEDGRVLFVDGSWVVADSIIYSTGYSYSLPFLDTKGIVVIDDDRVGPLFEHTFPPSLAPSLSFVGIPRKIIGFPFFESQARWIAQLLSGKRMLPSWDEMMKSIKDFYHRLDAAGVPKHQTHEIANFDYCDRYGDYCDFPRIEQWRKDIVLATLKNADENLETYRDSWTDEELLQEAFFSAHFRQLGWV